MEGVWPQIADLTVVPTAFSPPPCFRADTALMDVASYAPAPSVSGPKAGPSHLTPPEEEMRHPPLRVATLFYPSIVAWISNRTMSAVMRACCSMANCGHGASVAVKRRTGASRS